MQIFLLVVHILISIVLVLVILAQTSKGNGLDSNLGGAASNVFGSGASDMLRKMTQVVGGLFLVSCIVMALNVKTNKTDLGLEKSLGTAQTSEDSVAEQIDLEESNIQDIPTSEVTPETQPVSNPTETKTESTDK